MKIFVFVFFAMSLMIVQKGFTKDPFDNPLYNTLYSKDCTIPEQAQIIHYPMIHPPSGLISFKNFLSFKTNNGGNPDDYKDSTKSPEEEYSTVHPNSDYGAISSNDGESPDYYENNPNSSEENGSTGHSNSNYATINPDNGSNSDYFNDSLSLEYVKSISYSSFQLIQLLKDHPSALVFDEILWTEFAVLSVKIEAHILKFIDSHG